LLPDALPSRSVRGLAGAPSSKTLPPPASVDVSPAEPPASMAELDTETVAECLRDGDTRSATLAALERHAAPIPINGGRRCMSLAARLRLWSG
jgi:hypothetical protein